MDVSLPPRLQAFVREEVACGRYEDESDVVRAALCLLEESEAEQAAKLARLRAALAEGEADLAAGRFTVVSTKEELDALFAEL